MAPAEGATEPKAMSVKELKLQLTQLRVDFTGATEKCELVALLEEAQTAKAQAPAAEAKVDDEPEDEPVVKELKELDDQYLALEREFEAEERALRARFKERQNPLLKHRAQILADATEAEPGEGEGGTPGLQGFWCASLGNHPSFGRGDLQEWDVPALEYLKDITSTDIEDEDHLSFRLDFVFAENPFFEETVLSKTYTVREASPWNGEQDVKQIRSTKITWKSGQDVTVALTKKKVKGGGAKKAKAKEKAEPRISFFRTFLDVNLTQGEVVPGSLEVLAEQMTQEMAEESGQAPEDLESESCAMFMMERDYGMGMSIKDSIIPYAVRFYTGEACPDDDDEGDDDDEDDDEEDDDDDDDEEEVEMEPKPKGKAKSKAGAKAKADPKAGGGSKKEEDCKQQ